MSKPDAPSAEAGADARQYVDQLLARAMRAGASDIHVEPIGNGAMIVRFRVDGMLETIETVPVAFGHSAALRLMVMAHLLTYRLDIPQEGRIKLNVTAPGGPPRDVDARLAIMPIAHGLRAVVRLPAELTQPRALDDLGLPPSCVDSLKKFARGDSGMLLITGPAGSGKTTTIYAILEHVAKVSPGLSIISLEDPVERMIPGITQIEVAPHGQLTYERALKSILRQDPQVLMLGEIRDAATASIAVQAALSGHRLIATLHAGDPAGAIARLHEMGIEPYQISSSVFGVLSQRLLRKLASGIGVPPMTSSEGPPNFSTTSPSAPTVLDTTQKYKGRVPIAEFGLLDEDVRKAIVDKADAGILRNLFHRQQNHVTLRQAADRLMQAGITDSHEVSRILGD